MKKKHIAICAAVVALAPYLVARLMNLMLWYDWFLALLPAIGVALLIFWGRMGVNAANWLAPLVSHVIFIGWHLLMFLLNLIPNAVMPTLLSIGYRREKGRFW